jgi:hypothetical protein
LQAKISGFANLSQKYFISNPLLRMGLGGVRTVQKKAQTFKDFPEIPGESLMDRRVRFWKWKRSQGAAGYLGKASVGQKPTIKTLARLVQTLLDRVHTLEQSQPLNTKDGEQC